MKNFFRKITYISFVTAHVFCLFSSGSFDEKSNIPCGSSANVVGKARSSGDIGSAETPSYIETARDFSLLSSDSEIPCGSAVNVGFESGSPGDIGSASSRDAEIPSYTETARDFSLLSSDSNIPCGSAVNVGGGATSSGDFESEVPPFDSGTPHVFSLLSSYSSDEESNIPCGPAVNVGCKVMSPGDFEGAEPPFHSDFTKITADDTFDSPVTPETLEACVVTAQKGGCPKKFENPPTNYGTNSHRDLLGYVEEKFKNGDTLLNPNEILDLINRSKGEGGYYLCRKVRNKAVGKLNSLYKSFDKLFNTEGNALLEQENAILSNTLYFFRAVFYGDLDRVHSKGLYRQARSRLMYLQLRYVDKTPSGNSDGAKILRKIFSKRNKDEFSRLKRFTALAPIMFSFCQNHNELEIRTYLGNNKWYFYTDDRKYLQAVDDMGCVSLRIKSDGETTVSFLTKSPFQHVKQVRKLDKEFLRDRESELLKFSFDFKSKGATHLIPISSDSKISSNWDKGACFKSKGTLMGFAHTTCLPPTISADSAAPAA